MKKALSVLSLIAILGMSTPAMAAPGGPGGPGGHGGPPRHGGGHVVHAGHHHRPPAMHHHGHHRPPVMHHHHYRPHGGVYISTGYPRHRYWGGYGVGYWGSNWCDYRLGYYDPYICPPPRPYIPMSNVGFSIRF